MTMAEAIVVLMATPLIGIIAYGTWRFYTDPDGSPSQRRAGSAK